MIRVRQTSAVGKMGVGHAELRGILVHDLSEYLFGTGDMFGQRHTGIIAGLDNDTLEQLLDSDLLVHLDKHARAFHAPSFLADHDEVAHLDVAFVYLVGNHISGHHLGQTGRLHMFIDLFLGEDASGVIVHHQIRGGINVRCSGDDCRASLLPAGNDKKE